MKWARQLLTALCLTCALATTALAASVEKTAAYLLDAVPSPQLSDVGGAWTVLGLARSGYEVPQSYWDGYYDTVVTAVEGAKGVLHARKYTEYARVALTLTAIGRDPQDVAGYDLLEPLLDYDKVTWQGVNGAIWALLAFDSGNYAALDGIRSDYVDYLLTHQCPGGGWSLNAKGEADVDITAMTLQALAPYRSAPEVETAIQTGVEVLSNLQLPDGGYDSWGGASSESTGQVIMALCTLDIDVNTFVKNGHTLLDNLQSYAVGGGFAHVPGGEADLMATEQALCALVAVERQATGQPGLYQMRGAKKPIPPCVVAPRNEIQPYEWERRQIALR